MRCKVQQDTMHGATVDWPTACCTHFSRRNLSSACVARNKFAVSSLLPMRSGGVEPMRGELGANPLYQWLGMPYTVSMELTSHLSGGNAASPPTYDGKGAGGGVGSSLPLRLRVV